MNINRKTDIPVKTIPAIVSWLVDNCSPDEKEFMAALAEDKIRFSLLNSIFTRLTDCNIHEVFYGKIDNPEALYALWSSKRGEVAGLKAFAMACQAIKVKKKEKVKKKGGE